MSLNKQYQTLRLILGDQLNASHSWFNEVDNTVLFVIAELHQEQQYVKHHVQKICAFFASMENFSQALRDAKHHCLYLTLDDTQPFTTINDLIANLCKQYKIKKFEYQYPDEYRLKEQLANINLTKNITVSACDTEHFLLPFAELPDYFSKNKHHKMEFFYRKMRKRFHVLMDGDEPIGGQWNFDSENRNAIKKSDLEAIPKPLLFAQDVSPILDRLKRHQIQTIGNTANPLPWPTTRRQALDLLDYFCKHCLIHFGRFQDAMTNQSDHGWSLYHSRLSFALNSKMLHPYQVIQTAISAYDANKNIISIAQIEGFVRQIIGWREYVRGVYWANMPDYKQRNTLNAKRSLPAYFWTGKTNMRCMQASIQQSLDYAYAHHIQRLMVTGNFCLLTGIEPDEVDEWYLGIYIDAIEWVEMPNTRGMSQFADGGIVATKPYTAGGNYINKMSDYCKDCTYKVKEKTNNNACPLNSLYWRFMVKHRESLEKNPRIGMVYRNWDKQSDDAKASTLARADEYLLNIESL